MIEGKHGYMKNLISLYRLYMNKCGVVLYFLGVFIKTIHSWVKWQWLGRYND